MLRSLQLIFLNEFRLQLRDRTALFMLFVAPVLIIAVAGFSLGNLFGAAGPHSNYLIAVVDQDHGRIAAAIIRGLAAEPNCELMKATDVDAARRIALDSARAPLAIVIPPKTTDAFEAGRTATVEIMVDPVKRLQADALELRLNELSQHLANVAQADARLEFTHQMAELRSRLDEAGAQARKLQFSIAEYRRQLVQAQRAARQDLRAEIQRRLRALEADSEESIARAIAMTNQKLEHEIAERRATALGLEAYFQELTRSKAAFDTWFLQLKAMAGANARRIPPPPAMPPPPAREELAQLTRPLAISIVRPQLPPFDLANLRVTLPDLPALPSSMLDPLRAIPGAISIPGAITWKDTSLASSAPKVSAFEQYVPGFGVTFLMIDMLWGMSVALMDERQWGTLQRLRISGASTAGMLLGRLSARTIIGFLQMMVLFGTGWLLFGINLGIHPAMLMLPASAIAFAAAGFGLVVAAVAPSRDSALPIGSVGALVMSALGGCWWPLEFEPAWMRTAALTVPTTWTMRAFNDLMIRGLAPGAAVWPTTMAFLIGLVFLSAGIAGSPRLYR